MIETTENRNRKAPEGTGFVNLNKLLHANRNNKLGANVNSQINKEFSDYNTQLKGVQDEFSNQYNTEVNKLNQANTLVDSIAGEVQSDPKSLYDENDDEYAKYNYQSGTAYDDYKNTKDNLKYLGPEGYNQDKSKEISNRASTLDQYSNLLRGKVGNINNPQLARQELLTQFINRPDYTYGQRALDSVLYDANKYVPSQIASRDPNQSLAQSGFGNLSNKFNTLSNIVKDNTVGSTKKQFNQFGDVANQKFEDILGKVYGDVDTSVKNYNDTLDSSYSGLVGRLQRGESLTDNDYAWLNSAGLGRGTDTYGLKQSLPNYLQKAQSATRNELADDYSRARILALNKLLGKEADVQDLKTATDQGLRYNENVGREDIAPPAVPGAPGAPSAASTPPSVGLKQLLNFDRAGFDQAASNAKQQYDAALSSPRFNFELPFQLEDREARTNLYEYYTPLAQAMPRGTMGYNDYIKSLEGYQTALQNAEADWTNPNAPTGKSGSSSRTKTESINNTFRLIRDAITKAREEANAYRNQVGGRFTEKL